MSTARSSADDHGVVDVVDAPAIPGLRFRRYRGPIDHEGMVRVANAQAAADGDPERVTVAGIDSEYKELTNCDPDRDVLIATVDGLVVAYSRVTWQDQNDGSRRYDAFGFVDPAWRRQGLGRAMLRHGLARLRAIGAGHAEVAGRDRWFGSWGEDANLGNSALLRAHGFRPIRHFPLMVRRDLEEIELPPLPDGIVVRPALPGDYRTIFDADIDAFRDHFGGVDGSDSEYRRWVDAPTFDPSLLVVGWDGSEVAGGVWCVIDPEENEAHGYLRGWVESVFTRRAWRQRGIARALLARALMDLRERGMTSAQLGVDLDNQNQALGLYEGLGFAVAQRSTVWRRDWDQVEAGPEPSPAGTGGTG